MAGVFIIQALVVSLNNGVVNIEKFLGETIGCFFVLCCIHTGVICIFYEEY